MSLRLVSSSVSPRSATGPVLDSFSSLARNVVSLRLTACCKAVPSCVSRLSSAILRLLRVWAFSVGLLCMSGAGIGERGPGVVKRGLERGLV